MRIVAYYVALITFLVLIAFRFVQRSFLVDCRFHFVKREVNFQSFQDQRPPDEHHRKNDDMTNEIELFVDCEPFIEPKVGERNKTVAGNDESVRFADDEDADPVRKSLSSFLVFRIICKHRHNLLS